MIPTNFLRRFAVRGVFWRQYLDWAISNVPFYFLPVLIWLWTIFFFFFAAPARRAILSNLEIILPDSNRLTNYLRAWRTMYNFAWTIAEGSQFKLNNARFTYEIEGADALERLAAARSAIVLTAHMGNYDLGAALFAEKFQREIRMVRAPEPHRDTALHLAESIKKTGAGGVRVDYTSNATALSFDLLRALRENEIVSIQGDRLVGDAAHSTTNLFGREVSLPSGPFILSQIAEAPIFPLFIVRLKYRAYKIIVRDPIICERGGSSREEVVDAGLRQWSLVLQDVIQRHWDQWYAFVPTFAKNTNRYA
jgi:phosphatidylinositol dimannoside acyltransferase